ncbi:MAG: hypothetical protein KFW09_05210, partial [Oscillospiraceae bacterium]|nr:hypothetical protein [Oscillospiraceae bacterium]
MFNGKALEDKFKNLTVVEEEKLEISEELGAVGGVGISDSLSLDIPEYRSVFYGEIVTVDLEEETEGISLDMIKKELQQILKNNHSEVYTKMFKEEIFKLQKTFSSEEKMIDFLCEREIYLYNKLKYLNLPFFVIGSRPVSLPKEKLNKIAHLDRVASKNMGILSENSYGSILQMNYWWIMTNDMLILSIIFNRITVYIGSPRCKYTMYVLAKSRPMYSIVNMETDSTAKCFNLMFPKKKYCITNFARELLGMLIAGYRIQNTGIGEGMVPPTKYIKLTLTNYVKAIEYFEKT